VRSDDVAGSILKAYAKGQPGRLDLWRRLERLSQKRLVMDEPKGRKSPKIRLSKPNEGENRPWQL
jgi:hypothetical protein